MAFWNNLKTIRGERAMSIEDLADKLHIEPEEVERWETGETSPTLHQMIGISDALGTTMGMLLADETSLSDLNQYILSQYSEAYAEIGKIEFPEEEFERYQWLKGVKSGLAMVEGWILKNINTENPLHDILKDAKLKNIGDAGKAGQEEKCEQKK